MKHWEWERVESPHVLIGKTLTKVEGLKLWSEHVKFFCEDGTIFHMLHIDDCCESVKIVDLNGNLPGSSGYHEEVIGVEVATNSESVKPGTFYGREDSLDESYTWVFLHIRTDTGVLTLRWLGESNGYYGEEPRYYIEHPKAT